MVLNHLANLCGKDWKDNMMYSGCGCQGFELIKNLRLPYVFNTCFGEKQTQTVCVQSEAIHLASEHIALCHGGIIKEHESFKMMLCDTYVKKIDFLNGIGQCRNLIINLVI